MLYEVKQKIRYYARKRVAICHVLLVLNYEPSIRDMILIQYNTDMNFFFNFLSDIVAIRYLKIKFKNKYINA
jgi:hypothetical protein